jgi:hypothetical protein
MDDLSPLRQQPFSDAIAQIETLMSQHRRSFLIGAGCSRCAGLPLTPELTIEVLSKLIDAPKAIMGGIAANFAGASDVGIEDYLSELVDFIAIAERRKLRSAGLTKVSIADSEYSVEQLKDALWCAKDHIKKTLTPTSTDVSVHQAFVRAIQSLRKGKQALNVGVDYMILNYDTLVEDALGLERIAFSDGIVGGQTGWWSPEVIEHQSSEVRILKLHGSIDWCLLDGETLPRRIRDGIKIAGTVSHDPVLIWPAATKYRETQLDPYAQLMAALRKSLRPEGNNEVVLAICGYRFADSHINLELDRALRESDKKLTLLIFTDMEKPTGIVEQWLNDPATCAQVRIHGKRGFYHGNTSEESLVDLPWWKFEVLTRIFQGER